MKKRVLYCISGAFGLCAIWFFIPRMLDGVDFVTLYLNVLPASWIYSAGIHSVLVMDGGHVPFLTPLGVALLYGVPCICFFFFARRSLSREKNKEEPYESS